MIMTLEQLIKLLTSNPEAKKLTKLEQATGIITIGAFFLLAMAIGGLLDGRI